MARIILKTRIQNVRTLWLELRSGDISNVESSTYMYIYIYIYIYIYLFIYIIYMLLE